MNPRRVVTMRSWPGSDNWKPPAEPARFSQRLHDRVSLVLVCAAERGAVPECFGLGAYLVVAGRSVLEAGIIVPDDLDTKIRSRIKAWARRHPVETPGGAATRSVVSLGEFFDPRKGIFNRRVYSGAGWCIGADLGRSLGLAAEHVVERRGRNTGCWEVWLPGWGTIGEAHNVRRRFPHHPCLRISARRVGWQVAFGPCEKGNGKYEDGRQFPGRFLDVLSGAYALDGDRGASFSEHRENFGLAPVELPLSVSLATAGAVQVAAAAGAVHELAVALDRECAQWFTNMQDRNEGRGRQDLAHSVSPGGLAAQVPARFRVRPPLETFDLTEDEGRRWAETFHGGWCEADPRLTGITFSAVSDDVSSCFPLVAALIGWWDLLCAKRIARRNVTAELRRVCERVASDSTAALDPAIWRRFGCCLVTVRPSGQAFPVEVEDRLRPDGRLEVVPLFSPDRLMHYSALDVIAAAADSGDVPEIVGATAYVPVSRQSGLRKRRPILPGLVASVDEDPALELVRHRRSAKDRGDTRLAAVLRVMVNSLVFGNLARFDEVLRREDRGWVRDERPGPWNCLPVASSVTAGSHLLLAAYDRMVRDRGGIVAYRDTDSVIVPASPTGGALTLTDGSTVHELSWAEHDEIREAFGGLSPAPWWPVWECQRGTSDAPLRATVFGPKRHVEAVADQVLELTEAGLGGSYADPSGMRGRSGDIRSWSRAAVERELAYNHNHRDDHDNAVRESAPWDAGHTHPFPALRRLMVKTPEMVRLLPAPLEARPGTRYVEASGAIWHGPSLGRTVVALDPGGALEEWPALSWFDKQTGQRVQVTTEPAGTDTVVIESLAERAALWSRRPRSEPIGEVVIDADLIAYAGRVSGVIDADADGLDDLRSRRTIHREARRLSAVNRAASAEGPRGFARRTGLPLRVAERAALGKPISVRNVAKALEVLGSHDPSDRRCALDGCEETVRRPNAQYCSKAHRDRAYRLRRKARANAPHGARRTPKPKPDPFEGLPTCAYCDTVLLGLAAERGTCSAHKVAS